jgi:hypothetical protein
LVCLYDSKVFPTHVNPERHQSALHSLRETSWALSWNSQLVALLRFHVNSTKRGV